MLFAEYLRVADIVKLGMLILQILRKQKTQTTYWLNLIATEVVGKLMNFGLI